MTKALTSAFADDRAKNMQWTAFLRKSGTTETIDLSQAIEIIAEFAVGPLHAATFEEAWEKCWPPGGPWRGAR